MDATENNPVETNSGDNLDVVDVLKEFNTNRTSSPEEKPQAVVETVEDQTQETTEETTKEQTMETPMEPQQEGWLIDNKFKDDEEGRSKLATAYRELQGKMDKELKQYKDKEGKTEKLLELDGFLQKNPAIMERIIADMKSGALTTGTPPPAQPEDYDILDETMEGSSSHKWRQEYNEWLVTKGKMESDAKVKKMQEDLRKKEEEAKQKAELSKLGLDEKGIEEYKEFFKKPENLSTENLVKFFQFVNGGGQLVKKAIPTTEIEDKPVSAAAVAGSNPPAQTSQDKLVEQFWGGIMKNARNNQ